MENSTFKTVTQKILRSITLKVFIIGVLALLLLIPTFMVEEVIEDRLHYKKEAENEVAESWGDAQTLNGPFITIPYHIISTNNDGEIIRRSRLMHFTPDELFINGQLSKVERKLSIYEISLYKSKINFKGNFDISAINSLDSTSTEVFLNDAYLSLGISDPAGISKSVELSWDENKAEFQSGIPNTDLAEKGIHSKINLLELKNAYSFNFDLELNGSKYISFIPVGQETNVKLHSDWPDPGFSGDYLPDHQISENGFEAEWNVFHLSRDIPSQWIGSRKWDYSSAFGVSLIQLVDEYQKNMRSIKYAFLIICLTFLAFFLSELIIKKPVHPFQYIMVGFALVIFYILLVSISEHLGFDWAYLVSSVLTGGLITLYLKAVFRSTKTAMIYFVFFALIYGLSFVILMLEGYSLLIGALSLFLAIAATMYLTRNIDWYNINTESTD